MIRMTGIYCCIRGARDSYPSAPGNWEFFHVNEAQDCSGACTGSLESIFAIPFPLSRMDGNDRTFQEGSSDRKVLATKQSLSNSQWHQKGVKKDGCGLVVPLFILFHSHNHC